MWCMWLQHVLPPQVKFPEWQKDKTSMFPVPVLMLESSVVGTSGPVAMQTIWCNVGNSLFYVRQENILVEQSML